MASVKRELKKEPFIPTVVFLPHVKKEEEEDKNDDDDDDVIFLSASDKKDTKQLGISHSQLNRIRFPKPPADSETRIKLETITKTEETQNDPLKQEMITQKYLQKRYNPRPIKRENDKRLKAKTSHASGQSVYDAQADIYRATNNPLPQQKVLKSQPCVLEDQTGRRYYYARFVPVAREWYESIRDTLGYGQEAFVVYPDKSQNPHEAMFVPQEGYIHLRDTRTNEEKPAFVIANSNARLNEFNSSMRRRKTGYVIVQFDVDEENVNE